MRERLLSASPSRAVGIFLHAVVVDDALPLLAVRVLPNIDVLIQDLLPAGE